MSTSRGNVHVRCPFVALPTFGHLPLLSFPLFSSPPPLPSPASQVLRAWAEALEAARESHAARYWGVRMQRRVLLWWRRQAHVQRVVKALAQRVRQRTVCLPAC